MPCFLERLGGKPLFFRDLAKGETAATLPPIAKSLEKPGLETSECKEACHPVNGYRFYKFKERHAGYLHMLVAQ